jgi:hypothetical protein
LPIFGVVSARFKCPFSGPYLCVTSGLAPMDESRFVQCQRFISERLE